MGLLKRLQLVDRARILPASCVLNGINSAATRFGAETAERLSGVLAGIADPEGLAEVGEWLVRCKTGSEFLSRAVDPVAGANRRGDSGSSHAGRRED